MLLSILLLGLFNLCFARDVALELEKARSSIHRFTPDGRIIGGEIVNPHSVKYMAYIVAHFKTDPNKYIACGGSLISKRHVLTAAHCLEGFDVDYVLLGAHNVTDDEPEQDAIAPDTWKVHQQYNIQRSRNDLGVIKLSEDAPVDTNDNVEIVTLEDASDANKPYVSESATAYGWGLIHDTPTVEYTDVLWKVKVDIISNQDCYNLAPLKNIYSGDICTSGKNVKGTCKGDSGGPLMYNGKQIGITSRGVTAACEKSEPSVYVRVAAYRDWIDEQIKNL